MRTQLGEEGTEQFTVETRVDGTTIRVQPIHDPFINCTTVTRLGAFQCLKAFFGRGVAIRTEVIVRGSEAAQRAIMTLDPEQLTRETEQILEERRNAYENREVGGAIMAGYTCGD